MKMMKMMVTKIPMIKKSLELSSETVQSHSNCSSNFIGKPFWSWNILTFSYFKQNLWLLILWTVFWRRWWCGCCCRWKSIRSWQWKNNYNNHWKRPKSPKDCTKFIFLEESAKKDHNGVLHRLPPLPHGVDHWCNLHHIHQPDGKCPSSNVLLFKKFFSALQFIFLLVLLCPAQHQQRHRVRNQAGHSAIPPRLRRL
mgnify:CR=1 FL=1